MSRLSSVSLLVLLAMVLAACGEAASSPSPTATPQPTPTPVPTPTGTDGSPAASPGDDVNQDPDLEARLPDQIGDIPLQKFSVAGSEFLEQSDDEFRDFLARLNADPEDISVAVAVSMSQEVQLGIFAFRVGGADEDRLVEEFQRSIEEDAESGVTWEERNLGGRDVQVATDPDAPEQRIYLWADGDTIFFVTSPDEALAEEAIELTG